ncbi:hypothetical protein ABT039_35740 [Streptomyces lasiicapitis]|uniref:hypothetical protein n=1 Tax=Streptomyces lasiicapitis TaxID=1923961 RepID=UPI00332FE08D
MTSIALVVALAGCSKEQDGEERNYATPNSLCGVAVKSILISPFLPPGDHVSTKRTFPDGGTEQCTLTVDRANVTVIAKQKWWPEKDSVLDVAPSSVWRKSRHTVEGDNFLYSGIGAVGKTKDCADPTHPDQSLFTIIQSFTPDREDARTMQKLIKAYTKEVEQSKACHPKRPEPSKS